MQLKYILSILLVYNGTLYICFGESVKDLFRSNWLDSIKKLKQRIKNAYKQQIINIQEHVGIGPKPSPPYEFPGFDEEKRSILKEMWQEYYKCLDMQSKVRGMDDMLSPQAIVTLAGQNVKLDCILCVSPEDAGSSIDWEFSPPVYESNFTVVEEQLNIQISPYELALNIFSVQREHEGMYVCKTSKWGTAPYFLHVLDIESNLDQVKLGPVKNGPFPRKPLKLPESNLIIWNEWTPWSQCSWCGPAGKRKRIGYCKISLIDKVPSNITSKAETYEYKTTEKLPKAIIRITEQLLTLFDFGIPCVSNLLTKKLREHQALKNYFTETAVGYCKESCPGSVIVQTLNRHGNVIDTFNNTAGEYSNLQNIPGVAPDAQRLVVYMYTRTSIEIACPGNLYVDCPPVWTTKGVVLTKEILESLSDNRITINEKQNIVIKNAQITDSKVYSCWQMRELAGVVILNVLDEIKIDPRTLLEIIKLFAAVPVLLVFIYVIVRIRMDAPKSKAINLISKDENKEPV